VRLGIFFTEWHIRGKQYVWFWAMKCSYFGEKVALGSKFY